jgi:hypothetical protein
VPEETKVKWSLRFGEMEMGEPTKHHDTTTSTNEFVCKVRHGNTGRRDAMDK